MTTTTPSTRAPEATGIARAQFPALILGVLGLVACAIGFFLDGRTFYRSWLPAWLFWFEIAAGGLAILMLQYVTGGVSKFVLLPLAQGTLDLAEQTARAIAEVLPAVES